MVKHKKIVRKGVVFCIALVLLATGCGKTQKTGNKPATERTDASGQEEAPAQGNKEGSVEELITQLRAKYDGGIIDYSGDTIAIGKDEVVQIKLGYNPWEDGKPSVFDSFVVYQDAQLKYPLETSGYDWDQESGMLTIEPPVYGPAEVVEMGISHPVTPFLESNDETGWGSLSQLYLAAYVDAETGRSIEGSPLVTVLKIKTEIEQAPQVKFSQDDFGAARFSWKKVKGAEEYFVFKIKSYDGVLDGYIDVLASTADTQWTAEQSLSMNGDSTVTMNDMFRQYLASKEDADDQKYVEYFGVIAVSSTGSSHISNLFNGNELAHMLPYAIAFDSNAETIGVSCQGTPNLPAAMGITMCDGSVSQRVIEYDKSSIEKNADGTHYQIKFKTQGTPFTSTFLVTDQDEETLDAEIEEIEKRQEKLKNKSGNIEADISFINGEGQEEEPEVEDKTTEPGEPEVEDDIIEPKEEPAVEDEITEPEEPAEGDKTTEPEKSADEISFGDEAITANSALSEYLAIQMLDVQEAIDVSAFPEAADTSLVVDAFLEAQYQNPLILGIKEVGMDTVQNILYVKYDYDKETTKEKQREVKEKVTQITEEIITDGMNELEKELAINQYLCDNGEYDHAALESAEENDFKYVDEIYNDSFTAYGVLVNGIGVCASYSAGFKLLADAAGLDSIVVTGYLDGSLPHAWNKVKLDGQWSIVDATNNDNDVIGNALLNLSDASAGSTLAEDDRFVLDGSLYNYGAPSDDKEYYRLTDNYYPMEGLTDILAEKLLAQDNAVLRTDYSLDDETFGRIAQETADELRGSISGFHWMGVIHLEKQQ